MTNYQCNRCWHIHEKTSKVCECDCHMGTSGGTWPEPYYINWTEPYPDTTGAIDGSGGIDVP